MGGEQADPATDYTTMNNKSSTHMGSSKSVAIRLMLEWAGTLLMLIVIFMVRCALEVAVPLYLTRRYIWTPTRISMVLLTITLPAVLNPVIGGLTSSQGPRWWSTAGFIICGGTLFRFGQMTGSSDNSQMTFVIHLIVVGLCLAVLINANQVAISVASQRYGFARTQVVANGEELGLLLSMISPSTMLSGVTSSWAAGSLLGPAFSSLVPYTEDAGWQRLCQGLGGLCLIAAAVNVFLWRKW
ncbi:hypothetical protein DM02DRAFT_663583 [Periconia macrospinosa]|uniref:MFS general substrate transporter n=1 Tax=Periconia macrospinosa TaxID=97972 RepID=A0A2V1D1C5_9PLEO|nr:hypothetical protein DM02DRAFT_663583 [Periconia macrospinosa]